MSRDVKVKICGLTREQDVDRVVDLGASYCGFIVYWKSPRGQPLERAAELAKRVGQAKSVVVDVEAAVEDLKRYQESGFDYFQIHAGLEKLAAGSEYLPAISERVGRDRLWIAPRISPQDPFPEHILPYVATVLIDTFHKDRYGGTGETGDWKRIAQWIQLYPETNFLLSGGLKPENLADAVRATGANRIDLSSGVEAEPGIKSPEKLDALFGALKSV
jgi:phosphoribosylanthranilate isomerase